jgi:hypothetical protein
MDPVLVQVVLVHLERTSFRKVADRLAQKRIFRVATELLQNMLHHALPAAECVFTVEVRADRWTLVARNPLSVETGDKLAARWEELTSAPYEHGGGGLGLYEILRRADGGVNCECLSFDNGTAAVEFTAHILIPHE